MHEYYCIKLRELRLAHSYSQADIAYILSIRQEQYSKYESGVRELPLHLLIKLCTIYKVSADYVLGLKPATSPEYICSISHKRKQTSDTH